MLFLSINEQQFATIFQSKQDNSLTKTHDRLKEEAVKNELFECVLQDLETY